MRGNVFLIKYQGGSLRVVGGGGGANATLHTSIETRVCVYIACERVWE